ncbi:MAG: hypothetical protein ABEJ30_07035 [Halorientalis sp.]
MTESSGDTVVFSEGFESYQVNALPTNWRIQTGGKGGITGVVPESEIAPSAVSGSKVLALSWGDDDGEDTAIIGPVNPAAETSYTPSALSIRVYDPRQSSNDNWEVRFYNADMKRVFGFFGNARDKELVATNRDGWQSRTDTYWSAGWHEIRFADIDWQRGTTNVIVDGETHFEQSSFKGSNISQIQLHARNYDDTDFLVDSIRATA